MPRRLLNVTVNPRIANAVLRHQLDVFRFEANVRRRILRLLDGMHHEMLGKLAAHDLTRFGKARTEALINETVDAIEGYYSRVAGISGEALTGVARTQARAAARTLERTFVGIDLSASLPTETFLARIASNASILGAPTEEWWARQARDVSFRFSTAVRQGLVAGDTTEQVVARVAGRAGYPGVMDVTRANARSLVHTSIQQVSNDARFETFRQNDDVVEGIRQVSTLDTHTTEICMAYDGAEFDLDGNPINGTTLPYENGVPRHWGCRSVEVPITKTFKELGINISEPRSGERASEDGPVPSNWTFSNFLESLSKEEQDEALGSGRAQLWREGSITLQQLLDQKGNPLSLAELERRYA
jgi:hypothetical protein